MTDGHRRSKAAEARRFLVGSADRFRCGKCAVDMEFIRNRGGELTHKRAGGFMVPDEVYLPIVKERVNVCYNCWIRLFKQEIGRNPQISDLGRFKDAPINEDIKTEIMRINSVGGVY